MLGMSKGQITHVIGEGATGTIIQTFWKQSRSAGVTCMQKKECFWKQECALLCDLT